MSMARSSSSSSSSFKGGRRGGLGGWGWLIMAGRANRMRAASCCDININTLHQLLVTDVSWTKQGQWYIFKGPSWPDNDIITCTILVTSAAYLCSTFQKCCKKGGKKTTISWNKRETCSSGTI